MLLGPRVGYRGQAVVERAQQTVCKQAMLGHDGTSLPEGVGVCVGVRRGWVATSGQWV